MNQSCAHEVAGWTTFFTTLSELLRDVERIEFPNESLVKNFVSELEFRLSGLIDIFIFVSHQSTRPSEEDQAESAASRQQLVYLLSKIEFLIHTILFSVLPALRTMLERHLHDEPSHTAASLIGSFTEEQLLHLRTIGIKWAEIAEIFGMSHMTRTLQINFYQQHRSYQFHSREVSASVCIVQATHSQLHSAKGKILLSLFNLNCRKHNRILKMQFNIAMNSVILVEGSFSSWLV